MRIIIEDLNNDPLPHRSIVEQDGEHISDVLNMIIECLLGYGFQPESIKDAILGKAEEYEI